MTKDALIIGGGISGLTLARCLSNLGLDIDNGVIVNHRMQTSNPNIYAAGDVAQGPVLYSDRTAVHAIQPTAVDHGGKESIR